MSFQQNQSKKVKLNYNGICVSNEQCLSRHIQVDSPHQHYFDNKTMNYEEFKNFMNDKHKEYSDSQLSEQQLVQLGHTLDQLTKFAFYQKHLNEHYKNFKTLLNQNDLAQIDSFDNEQINKLLTISKCVDYQRNQQIIAQIEQLLSVMTIQPVERAEEQLDFYIAVQEEPQEDAKKDQPSNNLTIQNEPLNGLNGLSHEDSIHISVEEAMLKQEEIEEIEQSPPKIAVKSIRNLQTIKIRKNLIKKNNEKIAQINSDQEEYNQSKQTKNRKQSKQVKARRQQRKEAILTVEKSIQQIYVLMAIKQTRKLNIFSVQHKLDFKIPQGPVEKIPVENGIMFISGNIQYGYVIDRNDQQWVGLFNGLNLISGQLILVEETADQKIVYKIIQGKFQNQLSDGRMKIYTSQNESYEGDMVNNMMHGNGTYVGFVHTDDGLKTNYTYTYEGKFVENNFYGYGVQISEHFEYRGEFKKNYFNGSGEFKNKATGEVYNGQFQDHQFQGKGQLTLNGQYRYEGDFKNNQFDGVGIFTREQPGLNKDELFWNVKSYNGDFRENLRHGIGKEVLFNGNKFKGEFINDVRVPKAKQKN